MNCEHNLQLDHIYIEGSELDYKDFEKRGFSISDQIVAHPGSTSRFLRFKLRDDWNKDINAKVYLEIVERQQPGPKYGICFTTPHFDQFKEENKDAFNYTYRNFEWKEEGEPYVQGWKFLNSIEKSFSDIYPWIIYYDVTWDHIVLSSDYHPNGCIDIEEIIVSSDPQSFTKFSTTFKPSAKYESMFKSITRDSLLADKITAIVLKCVNPKLFIKFNPDYKKMELYGRDFIYFESGNNKDKIGIYAS